MDNHVIVYTFICFSLELLRCCFLSLNTSERALLNRLMIELHKLDSDVLIGHNISGFDLDVLLHRVQVCIYLIGSTFHSSNFSKIVEDMIQQNLLFLF